MISAWNTPPGQARSNNRAPQAAGDGTGQLPS
jgi:hypothetical protein